MRAGEVVGEGFSGGEGAGHEEGEEVGDGAVDGLRVAGEGRRDGARQAAPADEVVGADGLVGAGAAGGFPEPELEGGLEDGGWGDAEVGG